LSHPCPHPSSCVFSSFSNSFSMFFPFILISVHSPNDPILRNHMLLNDLGSSRWIPSFRNSHCPPTILPRSHDFLFFSRNNAITFFLHTSFSIPIRILNNDSEYTSTEACIILYLYLTRFIGSLGLFPWHNKLRLSISTTACVSLALSYFVLHVSILNAFHFHINALSADKTSRSDN